MKIPFFTKILRQYSKKHLSARDRGTIVERGEAFDQLFIRRAVREFYRA